MSVPPSSGLQSPAEPVARPALGRETAAASSSSTRDAVLTLLLREQEATAADLAARLGVSVQVMRRHLRSLEEEGLVEACTSQDGPGRPSNRWHLTSRGHDRFPDGSEHFALGLLQSLSSHLPPESLRQLMDDQARDKARQYRERIGSGLLGDQLARLVELRRSEGYVAELLPDPDNPTPADSEPLNWILREFHCSVMRIAEEFPLVCDQELQLIRHTFPDCEIERVHWRLDEGHFCGFRLSRRPQDV